MATPFHLPPFDRGDLYFALQHFGVAVSALAGAVAARGRRVDLFGVIVLALVTALGGGTIRDICLGATPVFWIADWRYAATSIATGVASFWLLRHLTPLLKYLELADAFSLALFTILGTSKSLALEANGFSAVVLGTITGVAGGVLRDVLLNELPLVFRPEIRLYATASVAGATAFTVAHAANPESQIPLVLGVIVTLAMRLAAIRWSLSLPVFDAPADAGHPGASSKPQP
ncbi:MAG: trimeric intracellular cation channel family protein [Verrucomicrobiales bacterium]|nr:trimeric intracellular cation channel family protein [Verrucomicrobiales bacterium]